MGLHPKVYYFYALRRNRTLKQLLSISLMFVLLVSTAFSPGSPPQNVDTGAKIKAVFIYNFTKYIEWPTDHMSGEFIIGILGENAALYKELDNMSKVKKVANQSFAIKTFNSIGEIEKPHILYIPDAKATELSKAVNKLKGKSTLIVTEKPGLAKQGSTINFTYVGNRQKFELNKSNAEQHNLKVASALEKLAIMVN